MSTLDPIDALGPAPPGPALDVEVVQQITSLHLEYCDSVDRGDFAAFARLFCRGSWLGIPGERIEDWMRRNIHTYAGATLTRHRVHDITLGPGGSGDEVVGTCAIRVTQQISEQRTLLVTHNTYADRFTRVAGRWSFSSRAMTRRLSGDDSWHRRREPTDLDEEGRRTCASSPV